MARWDPCWSYGESKVVETPPQWPYWSYGESKFNAEFAAALGQVSSNIAAKRLLMEM